ncbi:DNA polymerase delta subunit 3-like [Cimex lectularius]|uniref:DNA polymerase delta subunit 3 n=1 Tax=Cimex lectularius TaxID=79782 RepID=A0A8I6RJZ8_CIMLE|nr:DNA polymerase delta subunit 3-like [Cimex lectularius]
MGELQKYLRNIEDFVLVEDKIVTYKYLSKALQVHVNTAKQLLYAFSESSDNADKILTTYLIGGEQGKKGKFAFILVKSDEIEEAKKKFSTVSTEHVYSVQRAASITGTDLYNADQSYELTKEDKRFSSIRGNGEIKLIERKFASISVKEEVKQPIKKVVKEADTKVNNGLPNKQIKTEPLKSKQESELENDKKVQTSPKKTEISKKGTSPKKNTTKKKTGPVKGGGIGVLFSRQVTNAKNKEVKEVEKKEFKENIHVSNKDETNDEMKIEENEKDKKPLVKNKNESKKKKSKDSRQLANKKRKRIVLASESESSDEEMEYTEEAPPTPEQETLAEALPDSEEEIIPATPFTKGRKKVKKEVDNVFVDDNGFMVTKKEYVVESCSDDEASNEKKPKLEVIETPKKEVKPAEKPETVEEKPKKGKGKKVSPKGNKQRSITSFFQKK